MKRRFDLLVFDWDGTLFDSIGAIAAAVQSACRAVSIPEPSDAQARSGIGLDLLDAFRRAVPHLPDRCLAEFAAHFDREYKRREATVELYEGILAMIARLDGAGMTLGVATGKSRAGLDRVLAKTGLGRFFSATRCADECRSKPHPQMLLELTAELGVLPERTLMIGDTTHDLQMAINANVAALAVSYGAHPADELDALGPLARFDSVAALDAWLGLNACM